MITNLALAVVITVLVGIVFVQSYSIKTLSDSLENYAYSLNRLSHENAELRKLAQK